MLMKSTTTTSEKRPRLVPGWRLALVKAKAEKTKPTGDREHGQAGDEEQVIAGLGH